MSYTCNIANISRCQSFHYFSFIYPSTTTCSTCRRAAREPSIQHHSSFSLQVRLKALNRSDRSLELALWELKASVHVSVLNSDQVMVCNVFKIYL